MDSYQPEAVKPAHIESLAAFVTASPSSFHAARHTADLLVAAGFAEVDETLPFDARPGGYVLVRDGSVLAWRIPDNLDVTAFRIVGAHTDSPGFKLKPEPSAYAFGWSQAGMEVYGGPLLNSNAQMIGMCVAIASRTGQNSGVGFAIPIFLCGLGICLETAGFSDTQITEMLNVTEGALKEMTTAATNLGAAKSRIDLQKTFTTSLMDSIERGVGQLVDADMNKESTRLQALQVQQQLGIQALSIANTNAQRVLSLFQQ